MFSHRGLDLWSLTTFLLAVILIGPFFALIKETMGDSGGLWEHLIETVFPRYVLNTIVLMFGVALLSLSFGISTAWVVARFNFPGVKIIEWSLLLPATVPAYLIAYTYTDLLEFAGPIQTFMRDLFGWSSAQDYWFPEIRSMGGAILVMSSVLFPYIYLMARTAFRLTSRSYIELAKLNGKSAALIIDLSLARPAIIAGLALVLMEVLSDFGTVEYFAVETLTLGIFNIWLGMNNLTAAAQIAGLAFIFIVFLLVMEGYARRRQRFYDSGNKTKNFPVKNLSLRGGMICILVCLTPIILGFLIPVGVLLNFVILGLAASDTKLLILASFNSISVAFCSAIIVILFATTMVLTTKYKRYFFLASFSNLSALGYAFPGAILAIGVVSFAGGLDNIIQYVGEELLGTEIQGFLIGGLGLLIFAYVVRFQAIGHGAMISGVDRLSPNIMSASFMLGKSFSASVVQLGPSLFRNSMFAGGLLVFVDVMKELPMTLLLRPFNYETLATYVYQFAKDELLEESALAALIIILVGLGPVIMMNASQRN